MSATRDRAAAAIAYALCHANRQADTWWSDLADAVLALLESDPDVQAIAINAGCEAVGVDRAWFHDAYGLHNDVHHQHHGGLAACVPLWMQARGWEPSDGELFRPSERVAAALAALGEGAEDATE
jgi:hypothetical protein